MSDREFKQVDYLRWKELKALWPSIAGDDRKEYLELNAFFGDLEQDILDLFENSQYKPEAVVDVESVNTEDATEDSEIDDAQMLFKGILRELYKKDMEGGRRAYYLALEKEVDKIEGYQHLLDTLVAMRSRTMDHYVKQVLLGYEKQIAAYIDPRDGADERVLPQDDSDDSVESGGETGE